MKNTILSLIIFIISVQTIALGQDKKFYRGFGIEIGVGYNTATWRSKDHVLDTNITYSRNNFWIQPTFRLNYSFSIFKYKDNLKLKITPFIGYYTFGGKSKIWSNGYRDKLLFRSIEIGFLPTLDLYKKFQISVGVKGQYIFSAKAKYFGAIYQPDTIAREWTTKNWDNVYKKFSMNIGIKFRYKIKFITFGIESWFGITNLNAIKSDLVSLRVTENNYRILIGVEL